MCLIYGRKGYDCKLVPQELYLFYLFHFPVLHFKKMYIERMVALNNLASNTEKEENTIVPINFKDVMAKLKQFISISNNDFGLKE